MILHLSLTVRTAALLIPALALCPAFAHAQRNDGMYGRLERDLVLSAELSGGAAQPHGDDWAPAADLTLRARYLDMAGVALGFRRTFAARRDDALFVAVDLRPAFFARVNFDFQRGPRWLDLMLDSIGLELGAAWVRPGEGRGEGVAALVGVGVELPLYWRDGAEAVMLRAGARWTLADGWDVLGPGAQGGGVQVGLGIVVRGFVRGGVVPAR